MKILRIIGILSNTGIEYRMDELIVEEKPMSYVGQGFRVHKDKILKADSIHKNYLLTPRFIYYTYCLLGDIHKAEKIIEDVLLDRYNEFKTNFDKITKGVNIVFNKKEYDRNPLIMEISNKINNALQKFVGKNINRVVIEDIKRTVAKTLIGDTPNVTDVSAKAIKLEITAELGSIDELRVNPKNLFTGLLMIGLYRPDVIPFTNVVIDNWHYKYTDENGFTKKLVE